MKKLVKIVLALLVLLSLYECVFLYRKNTLGHRHLKDLPKIQKGMYYDSVVKIMGTPDNTRKLNDTTLSVTYFPPILYISSTIELQFDRQNKLSIISYPE